MKKILSILALCALALPSCTTTGGTGTTPPANVSAYLAPAATIAASVVISKADSAEDRAAKAAEIVQIADAILVLTDPNTKGADIAAVVLTKAGSKPHWQALGLTLAVLYDQYAANYTGTTQAALVNSIAAGLKAGSTPYL